MVVLTGADIIAPPAIDSWAVSINALEPIAGRAVIRILGKLPPGGITAGTPAGLSVAVTTLPAVPTVKAAGTVVTAWLIVPPVPRPVSVSVIVVVPRLLVKRGVQPVLVKTSEKSTSCPVATRAGGRGEGRIGTPVAAVPGTAYFVKVNCPPPGTVMDVLLVIGVAAGASRSFDDLID